MEISKELIEKYQRGECSEEERSLVEEWLLDDSFGDDPFMVLPDEEVKEIHKNQIWEGIAPVLPGHVPDKKRWKVSGRVWTAAAASVLIITGAWFGIKLVSSRPAPEAVIVADNLSDADNRNINSDLYTVSLGPKSNVRIDQANETMQLCGALSFIPTENTTLKIVGECPIGESPQTTVNLKGGANYIAFSFQDNYQKTELIVVEENQLNTLPVFVQKQLITLFKI